MFRSIARLAFSLVFLLNVVGTLLDKNSSRRAKEDKPNTDDWCCQNDADHRHTAGNMTARQCWHQQYQVSGSLGMTSPPHHDCQTTTTLDTPQGSLRSQNNPLAGLSVASTTSDFDDDVDDEELESFCKTAKAYIATDQAQVANGTTATVAAAATTTAASSSSVIAKQAVTCSTSSPSTKRSKLNHNILGKYSS